MALASVLAGRLPFERVIGIDIDPDLVKRGNQNIARARGLRCPIELLCRDATVFDIPANATTLYFCNPFSGAVLVNVLEKVQGRDLQLVCNVPHRSGFEDEISRVDWLKLRKQTQLTDQRRCLIFTP